MIADITNWIMTLMQTHGALAVFVGVIIESIIVPIPSPLIIMGAGTLLIPTGLPFTTTMIKILTIVVIPGCVASTLGSYITYLPAYWGGKPVIDRFSKFIGFNWDDVLWMETKLKNKEALMIFLLRALPIMPLSLISAAAGVLRFPIVLFTLWTFLGSLPRNLILAWLGFLTRDSFRGIAGHIDSMESYSSLVIVAVAIGVILWLRKKVRAR